jgi:hypothetical protein
MADPASSRSTPPEPDPIADARALVAMAIGLGKRTRTVEHLNQTTTRKAALYVSTLVRHASRLLMSSAAHDVPRVRGGQNAPGGSATHFVIRSDRLAGPPAAVRLLVVGSDARLRCCVVAEGGSERVWADYDVSTAPADLPLRAVLDALSFLIARLEHNVTQLEIRQITRDAELDADIALSKARIAGLPDQPTRPVGVRREAVSEEPVRPWTRHAARARRLVEAQGAPPVATPATEPTGAAPAGEPTASARVAEPMVAAPTTEPTAAVSATIDPNAPAPTIEEIFAPIVPPTPPAVEPAAPVGRRGFSLSRLHKAI